MLSSGHRRLCRRRPAGRGRRVMIRRSIGLLVLFAAAVSATQTSGQQTPPPAPPAPQQPTFRARVDSVSVDVIVTDRQGRPVTDLTADDFEIREADKLQTIEAF